VNSAKAISEVSSEGFDLVKHLYRQRQFSEKTFGPGARTKGVLDHLKKELSEVGKNPDDVTEWIDIVLLAFDGAWRSGHSPEEIVSALEAKQTKNESRSWPDWRQASPDKAIEHVPDGAHPLIGKVVRYASGSSALFRVTSARPIADDYHLSGEHVLGGIEQRYQSRVELASDEDLKLWLKHRGCPKSPA